MAKSKKEKGRTVWSIEVLRESFCHTTREGDPEDRWDRDDTSTHWHVECLKLADKDSYSTVEVAFEPKKGNIYHLLYAVYSTGDSFGHDEGACFEVIGIYKDRKVAEENEKRLRPPAKEGQTWDEKYKPIALKTEGLGKHLYSRPWIGYFESLDQLEVLSLVLN